MFELKKTVNFNLVTDVLGRIKVQMGISNITGLVFYGDMFLQLPRKNRVASAREIRRVQANTLFFLGGGKFYPDYLGNDPF